MHLSIILNLLWYGCGILSKKMGGLKAWTEIKGTYRKESIMHVIRIVEREKETRERQWLPISDYLQA